jgi:hypothetical protein
MGRVDRMIARFAEGHDRYSIPQKDGTVFHGHRSELYKSFGLFYLDCLSRDYGEEPRSPVPEIFRAIAGAADREGALDQIAPSWRGWRTVFTVKTAIDLDTLVSEGRVKGFNWVEYIYENSPEGEDEDED